MESDHEEQKVNPKYLYIMLRTINININIWSGYGFHTQIYQMKSDPHALGTHSSL
jgi:hypothetical protein